MFPCIQSFSLNMLTGSGGQVADCRYFSSEEEGVIFYLVMKLLRRVAARLVFQLVVFCSRSALSDQDRPFLHFIPCFLTTFLSVIEYFLGKAWRTFQSGSVGL